MLSEDILHNIFRQHLDIFPKLWPTLVWVCQRWRRIVFTSPLGLNLRLYCTYRTPVLKALCHWPTLPITIQYGGAPNLDPPAPEDDDNIITALKESSRVSSIRLTVTSSLLEKFSAISVPFTELEDFVLCSQDKLQMTLRFPNSLNLGPRLRVLHLTRVAIPSFPRLLSPSQDLVDIQLHEIPITGYFSPEAFANALSGTTQVRSLSLHFHSLPPRRNYLGVPPPSGERVILPALTYLKYRGTSKYLDGIVARIDAPCLGNIDITFFSQPTMDASQLGQFIERIEMQTSPSHAEVETSTDGISISCTSSSIFKPLRLRISCTQLDWQLSSLVQVCDNFSPFLSRVQYLGINTTKSPSRQNDVDSEQWPELLRPFGGAKDLSVAGELAADILGALRPADEGGTTDTTLLPSLHNLRVRTPKLIDGPFRDAALSFITSRQLSGRPVDLQFLCHICHTGYTRQQELKSHLEYKHAYQVVCSYCGDFDRRPGYDHLFRDHIKNEHPEVAHSDELFSNPFSTLSLPSELDGLVNRHSSLRAPANVAPSSAATTLHFPIASDPDTDYSDTDSSIA